MAQPESHGGPSHRRGPSRVSAAVDRGTGTTVYGSYCRIGAKWLRPGPAGRHRAGQVKKTSRHGAEQELPCKGVPRASGRWRHRGFGGSPVPRGVWGQGPHASNAARDPYRPPDQAPQSSKPDPGHRNDTSGCGEEKPKGRSRRGDYTAREDCDDLRRRRPQGRLQGARGGFSPSGFPPSRSGTISYMHLQTYPPQVGSHRQPRQRRGSRPQGGQPLAISRGYEYVYGHPAQKMRYAIPDSLVTSRTRLGIVLRPNT